MGCKFIKFCTQILCMYIDKYNALQQIVVYSIENLDQKLFILIFGQIELLNWTKKIWHFKKYIYTII
jgi:uncharacterized protein YhhL (DUF1145 family)